MRLLPLMAVLVAMAGPAAAIKSNLVDSEDKQLEFKTAWQHVFALASKTSGLTAGIKKADSSADIDAIFDEVIGLIAYSQPSVNGDSDKYGIRPQDPNNKKDPMTLEQMAKLAALYGRYQGYKKPAGVISEIKEIDDAINSFAERYKLPKIDELTGLHADHMRYVRFFAFIGGSDKYSMMFGFPEAYAKTNRTLHDRVMVKTARNTLMKASNACFTKNDFQTVQGGVSQFDQDKYDNFINTSLQYFESIHKADKDWISIRSLIDAVKIVDDIAAGFDKKLDKLAAKPKHKMLKATKLERVLNSITDRTMVIVGVDDTLVMKDFAGKTIPVEGLVGLTLIRLAQEAKYFVSLADKSYANKQETINTLKSAGAAVTYADKYPATAKSFNKEGTQGYEAGIIFAGEGGGQVGATNHIAEAFKSFIKATSVSLDDIDQVIYIDAKEDNLKKLQEHLKSIKKSSKMFRYTGAIVKRKKMESDIKRPSLTNAEKALRKKHDLSVKELKQARVNAIKAGKDLDEYLDGKAAGSHHQNIAPKKQKLTHQYFYKDFSDGGKDSSIKKIEKIIPHITPKTLVLLDIDETVILPDPTVDADKSARPIYSIEDNISETVDKIKKKAKLVLALTNRGMEAHNYTVKQLNKIGIDYASDIKVALKEGVFDDKHQNRGYKSGIIFSPEKLDGSDALNNKVSGLQAFLQRHPDLDFDKIIFVDDVDVFTKAVHEFLQHENKYSSAVFHYTGAVDLKTELMLKKFGGS